MPLLEIDAPPADSGILGPVNAPDALTVTIAFGASLFDGRYGLGCSARGSSRRCRRSRSTSSIPAQSHGDVLLQICANQRDTVVHTLRELLRTVRGTLQLRWTIDGFPGRGRGPDAAQQPAQPVRVPRRDRQPGRPPMRRDEPAHLGRGGRTRLGGRRHLPDRPHHPHARRVLGPRRAERAAEHDRPRRATAARRSAAPRSSRTRATTSTPTASGSRSTRTSGWPTRGPPRPPTSASCAAATTTPRLRRRRPTRPGTRLHRLQPEPDAPVRDDPEPPASTSR